MADELQDERVTDVDASDYDALVLPGGVANTRSGYSNRRRG
jgi:putative intracellular protease/amidase